MEADSDDYWFYGKYLRKQLINEETEQRKKLNVFADTNIGEIIDRIFTSLDYDKDNTSC
jgi:hypothetical protein